VTECQGCGAWNESSRALCVLCGTPLAETDELDATAELPPLPPLPDGGLSTSMPAWLREPPGAASLSPVAVTAGSRIEIETAPLGSQADPRTFLSDDDFPRWLRELAAREAERAPVRAAAESGADPAAALSWPSWPGAAASDGAGSATAPSSPAAPSPYLEPPLAALAPAHTPVERPPASVVTARAREERRGRSAWETLLLIVLVLGVVVAALWALVANGVFSPAL
jgi:hypothetical protein